MITTLPTATGQRLGFTTFGVRTGGSNYNSAAIQAVSSQQWIVSSARGTYLSFDTTADNTTTKMERMRIAANGNVGVGTANPQSKLSVAGLIQSIKGGFKFPDGTVQTSAASTDPRVTERIQALERAVAGLQATVAALQATVEGLQGTVASQEALLGSLQVTVSSQQTLIATLDTKVNSMDGRVDAVEKSEAMKLNPYLAVTTEPYYGLPLVLFTGVNLQLVNGLPGPDGDAERNGLGNLIVGYNIGGEDHTGSHNIVVGQGHSYSGTDGLVAGMYNTISGVASSITGGSYNQANDGCSVNGGIENRATGGGACSVSGGKGNAAGGWGSSITGGHDNGTTATCNYCSISGGQANRADGWATSVSGGFGNLATGGDADMELPGGHVSGGYFNTASGVNASVSGGGENTASGTDSSVSGGRKNTASESGSWVAGGYRWPQ